MIYLTAISDISKSSKFNKSILTNSGELIWGITELSTTTFMKIEKGDYVLFYRKFKIIGIGLIKETKVDKLYSKDKFGTYLHTFKGELYWSNLLILAEYCQTTIDFSIIQKLGNYSPKFSIRKLIALNSTGHLRIINNYGTVEKYIVSLIESYRESSTIS